MNNYDELLEQLTKDPDAIPEIKTLLKALGFIKMAVSNRGTEQHYDKNWSLMYTTDGQETARKIEYLIDSVEHLLENLIDLILEQTYCQKENPNEDTDL